MASHKHLTLSERIKIETYLNDKKTFSFIGKALDKDPSTIKKEVIKHRVVSTKGAYGKGHNDCIHRKMCKLPKTCERCPERKPACRLCGHCNDYCDRFEKEICTKTENAPFVCNGCADRPHCSLSKLLYDAEEAEKQYRRILSESREGIMLNKEELEKMSIILDEFIKEKHQSPHMVMTNNADCFNICEKTLYNYIGNNLFNTRNIDLSRKVRMSPRKCHVHHKVDRNCTKGRSYSDFLEYMKENPGIDVVEIDSVEGPKGTAVLLTIYFRSCSLQLAFKRESNSARSVREIFDELYLKIGHDDFTKLFPLILADNGTEFSDPESIENFIETDNKGNIINKTPRTRLFYCDPASPYQKGACERNHEFIRYFVAKGQSFEPYSQTQIEFMMNHINSYPRGKEKNLYVPTDRFILLYSADISLKLGIVPVASNDVTLSKAIFK